MNQVNPVQQCLQAEMREREELKKAIEQSDKLLTRVRQLEEENAGLSKEKNDTFIKIRAVSPLGFYL